MLLARKLTSGRLQFFRLVRRQSDRLVYRWTWKREDATTFDYENDIVETADRIRHRESSSLIVA